MEPTRVIHGDCRDELAKLGAGSFDAVVSDPPYGLEFMGKDWDSFGKAPTGGASFSVDGMGKGFKALPSFTGSPNRMCGNCNGSERGNDRKGFKRCRCDSPAFPNTRLHQMRAFQEWCEAWATEAFRLLKPGGYATIFGGTRTYHRLTCAVEDAGFEVRDCLMWIYGTGFPKGQGCLKPAWEPILLARKPGKRVAPLGVDACRIGTTVDTWPKTRGYSRHDTGNALKVSAQSTGDSPPGRYPANVLHDGSDEVLEAFAAFGDRSGPRQPAKRPGDGAGYCGVRTRDGERQAFQDAGSAARFFACCPPGETERCDCGSGCYVGSDSCGTESAALAVPLPPSSAVTSCSATTQRADGAGSATCRNRFFYCAKASKSERGKGNTHPTVKPLELMRWLVRLVCLPGGRVLDPFAGSGTTLLAAELEGRTALGIEKEAAYVETIHKRLASAKRADGLFAEPELQK